MPATEGGSTKVVDVLLVEDDPGDVLMTREAFEHHRIRNHLHVVNDGEQALQFLHQQHMHRLALAAFSHGHPRAVRAG